MNLLSDPQSSHLENGDNDNSYLAHLLIHSRNIWKSYYVPGTKNIPKDKVDKNFCPHEAYFLVRDRV